MILLDSAYQISQRSYNKQAMVLVLLEKANWEIKFNSDYQKAEAYYKEALISSENFSDKFFTIKTLDKLINLKESQKQFDEALIYEKQQIKVKEQMASYEKEKAIESLQMQFNVSEKDRKLHLIEQENEIIKLTNILLWGGIAIIIAIAIAVIQFLRKINNRNKQLLQTKEALMQAIEDQKRLKENQLQNDLDHKESQLSALALQMLRKNELLQELNEKLEQQSQPEARQLISRELNREKEWDDFNLYFEGLNKNFFNRLKEAFPEITPNDLRICALIKMNMSIKEMAAIMNISADSVKTARYRLRKKLQLNTEDNLTEFLMKL
jgi:DNA-binding CsgD family transcriptional regulator